MTRRPRLALWIASLRMPAAEREFALGDLIEEFDDRVMNDGARAARGWLWRQAFACLLHRWAGVGSPDERDRRAFGGLTAGVARDVGFALRLIRRAPLVSAAAILTFALGIGANAAIFSVAWPVLGAPLAFPDEDRLAVIMLSVPRRGGAGPNPISPGDYVDLLQARSFDQLAGFNLFTSQRNLSGGDEPPLQIRVGTVTEAFFAVLGVAPLLGRALDGRDFAPGVRSLVLHERTWRRHFGADRGVLGRAVRVDGEDWTVIGVMPGDITVGTIDVEAWGAQPINPATARQLRSYYLAMIGRLKRGVTIEEANTELATLMRGVAERYPASNKRANGEPILARAEALRERITGPVRPAFQLLIGGAVLVLVIAGINLAGLQMARNLARRHELDVRRALGAERGRLARQLTIENLVLAGLGGAAGLGAAALTLGALSRFAPAVAWYEFSARLTAPVVTFTLGLTLAAGLIVGVIPALAASAPSRNSSLRTRGATASRASVRVRQAIVGVQVAMTMVLLIAATLAAASLVRVLGVDTGFEIDRGLIADVRPPLDQGAGIRFFDELVSRAGALSGVARACAINHVPLDNEGGWMTFVAEGRTDADMISALPMGATEGCFETLRIPLVQGRRFRASETESVTIVTTSMAKVLWPNGEVPIGRRIHIGLTSGPLFTVIGVVGDIRASALESGPMRQVWMSASRGWPMPQRLILRTDVAPETLARPLRRLLSDMAPGLALANLRTMHDIVADVTASRRFVLALLGGFAAIALALSAVGIYGVLTHHVGQRRREIGIRVALGARRADVTRAVIGRTLVGVVAGIAAGVMGARLLSSIIAQQLYEMSPTDGRVYLAVTVFVLLSAAAACWSPTRRALQVDPVIALRTE